MSLIAIWVDHQEANVFKFTTAGIKKESYVGKYPDHHSHTSDHRVEQKHEEQVFKQLMPHINDALEILILGPGMAKTHLKKYIESHSAVLGKKIVGCENTDHPTEPQLLSLASKFFNSEHLK